MPIQEIIETFHHAVIQISTKTGTGTGFYLREYNLIVTNFHVVGDTRNAAIKGRLFKKQLSAVIFADARHDLAFLMPPKDTTGLPELKLGDYGSLENGDEVVAIGHPFGLNYSATQGVISRVDRVQQGIKYIQIDAAINPGNSGGPLIDEQGEIVGVNTFIIKGGDNLGFALPVSYLREALDSYKPLYGQMVISCPSCNTLVTEETLDNGSYCPNCGTEIDFPKKDEVDELPVSGMAKVIEDILEKLDHSPELARVGSNRWEIEEGSARIRLTFQPDSYFIISDAHLCRLPRQNIAPLYTYLLRENYTLRSKLFSLQGDNIVLSSLLYDLELNVETGVEIFGEFFRKADYYDTLLIEQYGCQPILEES